jgi:hypothetical protein
MKTKKILISGTLSGLAMGITLFIAGAIFSRIIYGPQFAPPGKFEPEQLNAFYFIWTKLLIGIFFGVVSWDKIYSATKYPLGSRIAARVVIDSDIPLRFYLSEEVLAVFETWHRVELKPLENFLDSR